MGRGFVDPTESPSGNAKIDLVATPGRRPRNRMVLVATWTETAWAEGSPTMTGSASGNAEFVLVATSGRRPRSRWCVFVTFGRLASCGRRVAAFVRFLALFSVKIGHCTDCMVFGPGFPYKLGHLILSNRTVDTTTLYLKKKV